MNNNCIKIDPKTNQIIGNNNTKKNVVDIKEFNNNFDDFYDIIIDIKSIKDISKGWEIKMTKRGEDNFNRYKNEKLIKVSAIGNSNKGKSFILSKLSKIVLPLGTSIKTKGSSVKYPELKEFKNRNIVVLDSASLETPVLIQEDEETKTEENKENKEKINDDKNSIYYLEKNLEKN